MTTTPRLRCRSYKAEAQNSRNISVWNRQCPHPATTERPLMFGGNKVTLPVCGVHARIADNGLRTLYAYQRNSDKYEAPVVLEMAR